MSSQSSGNGMDLAYSPSLRAELVESIERSREIISGLDQKANSLIAKLGVLMTSLVAIVAVLRSVRPLTMTLGAAISTTAAVVCAIVAIMAAAWTIWPRTAGLPRYNSVEEYYKSLASRQNDPALAYEALLAEGNRLLSTTIPKKTLGVRVGICAVTGILLSSIVALGLALLA